MATGTSELEAALLGSGAPWGVAFAAVSPAMQSFARLLADAAQHPVPVLLIGEAGTGKSTFARALHAVSSRAARPFVTVDCTSVVEDLSIPARNAHRGTLFLHEVAELPLAVQATALKLLQDSHPLRVRLVASTRHDLDAEMAAGRFRKDLFYRLNVLRLTIPALREVREDVPLILDAFLAAFAAELRTEVKVLSDETREALCAYDWPGNVRELRNCVEYLYNTVEAELVLRENLPPEIVAGASPRPPPAPTNAAMPPTVAPGGLEAVERQFLASSMQRLGGKPAEVAKVLGISRSTMYRKLKKHGLI